MSRLTAWWHHARRKGPLYAFAATVVIVVAFVVRTLIEDRFASEANRWIDLHAGEMAAMVLDTAIQFIQSGAFWWWVPIPMAFLLLTFHAYIDAWREERHLAEITAREMEQPPLRPRPLTLRERCKRLAEQMSEAIAEHDRKDPRKRLVGEFRWVRNALDPIKDELEDRGCYDSGLDLAKMGDNDRTDVQRALNALRRIDWDRVRDED